MAEAGITATGKKDVVVSSLLFMSSMLRRVDWLLEF